MVAPKHPTAEYFAGSSEGLALATAVVAGAVLVAQLIWCCGAGIDFTDEGYYLNWISNPSLYPTSVTQFGFIYHPLYQLLGGNIVLLRQINILSLLALAWLLFFAFFYTRADKSGPADSWHPLPSAGLSFVFSTSVLTLLHSWLPTPSYNGLALQALLLCGIALLLAKADNSRSSQLGWGLIGVSGWLAFMAKPTTAAALGFVIALYLVISGKLRIRMLALSVVIAAILVLLSAWCIDGSVGLFFLRLAEGAEDAKRLQGGYTLAGMFRWDYFSFDRNEKIALAGSSSLIFLATHFGYSSGQAKRLCAAAFTVLISTFCIAMSLHSSGLKSSLMPDFTLLFWPPNFGLLFWAAPIGAFLAAIALKYKDVPSLFSRDSWPLVLCFAAFPHVHIFGSNGNYWHGAASAAIFWVLSGIILLPSPKSHRTSWPIYLPLATIVQVGTVTLLGLSIERPYRQTQPLLENRDLIRIANTGSQLRVSPDFAIYVRSLDRLANRGGFKAGTPMIDLTGHYPTALYVLSARAIGLAWLAGGYPGSDAMASAALDRVPREDLKKAWVLTEPDGPRKLSPDILKRYGLDMAKDYIEVGTLDSPKGSYPDSYKQHLLKPTH